MARQHYFTDAELSEQLSTAWKRGVTDQKQAGLLRWEATDPYQPGYVERKARSVAASAPLPSRARKAEDLHPSQLESGLSAFDRTTIPIPNAGNVIIGLDIRQAVLDALLENGWVPPAASNALG